MLDGAALYRGSEDDRGTGCGKTARPGLHGGCRVTGIPTVEAHTLNHQLLAEFLSIHDDAHPLQKRQKSLSKVLKSLLDFRVGRSVYAKSTKPIEGFTAKEKRF